MASRVSTSSSLSSSSILFYLFLFSCLSLSFFPTVVHSAPVASSNDINRNFVCTSSPDMVFPKPDVCPYKITTLNILGFVPATNNVFESDNIIPAAYAAIDEINANCDMLGNYTLQLEFVNTLCDPSEATWQLIDSIILQNTSKKIAFFGGGCSLATEPVAALSGRFYGIPQISYGASSPTLSQRNMFPRFVRTIPSEIQVNVVRFALMKRYNWERVATLHETQTIFSLAVNDFHRRYDIIYNTSLTHNEEEENLIPRSFTDDPRIPLDQIKDKEIRIIFGYFYEDKANIVVCQAIRKKLFTKNHFWAFPAWFTYGWWEKDYNEGGYNCSKDEMRQAVNQSFFLDSYNFGYEHEEMKLETGSRTKDEFNKKYDCYLEEFQNNPVTRNITNSDSLPHSYRTFSYDAVYVTALALDATEKELAKMREENSSFTLSLDDYTYFDENIISKMITANMIKVDFTGITGRVRFDQNGTRVGLNAIYQLLIKDNVDSSVLPKLDLLAVHEPFLNNYDQLNFNFSYIKDPLFKSGSVPKDKRTPINIYMNSMLVYACYVFISIALLITLALLIFNIVTMFKPLVRDSAPHINTVIIVGCILMLTTCFLLSVDTANPPVDGNTSKPDYELGVGIRELRDHRYGIICNLRLWFLTIGFTLSFGALFAKTWQVYRVYTNPKLQKHPLKMWNFMVIMSIFLTVDVAYLSFWTAVYRFERVMVMAKVESKDVDNIFEMCQCKNFPYLIGALYVYKGLLVVFGLFLAYESRNVKYHYINDSRFVSIAMYIVIILVGIGAPLSLVLAVHNFIDAAYGLTVFMVIASTLSCLLIIFIPKFVFMARGKDTMVRENGKEEITVSDGLQLGHTTIDQAEVRIAEEEVSQLKHENTKKEQEISELVGGTTTTRTGSDGDSGVLVTIDENEIFSTDSTGNGDINRGFIATPSYEDDHLNDCVNEGVTTVEA